MDFICSAESVFSVLRYRREEDYPNFIRLDHATLVFASHEGESFFGVGAQFSHFDLKGHLVPILTSEQGVRHRHLAP